MKHLLPLLLLAFVGQLSAQSPPVCGVPKRVYTPVSSEVIERTPDGVLCSKVFVQVDYDIVADKGLSVARAWAEDLMNEVNVPYSNVGIEQTFEFQLLETPTYTEGSSYDLLQQFRANLPSFDGDHAILLSYKASGGVAWVDQVCRDISGYKYGFASVRPDFRPYDQGYSWSVEVIAHELGHLYGSWHTQDCFWNGDGTPIDGCYPSPGCDAGPIPTDGGTIMSYCHLVAGVGINFSKGFHPQVAAVMRATIYGRCETCDDPGDDGGDDDPPVVTCAENAVFVNLILDAYPSETRYHVLNSQGEVVFENGPFSRYDETGARMAGEVIADTLCLADGCYTFEVFDENGLMAEGCDEGMYYVGDPFGEIASGAAFTGKATHPFCLNFDPPNEGCDKIILRAEDLGDYSNQSRSPWAIVENVGDNGVQVTGNNWRAKPYAYTITPQTVLTFEATPKIVGEIQGVSLVDDTFGIYPDRSFRFAGTQNWGIEIEQIPEGETRTVTIPVGQYFTGDITHIVLVNDDDRRALVKTLWANMELCEDSGSIGGVLNTPDFDDAPRDETIGDVQAAINYRLKGYRKPYPNPVLDTLTLHLETYWNIYDNQGGLIAKGWGRRVNMAALPPGLYIVYDGVTGHKIVKK